MAKKQTFDKVDPTTAEVTQEEVPMSNVPEVTSKLADTRTEDLNERFCLRSETLGELITKRNAAMSGYRLPADEWKDLVARINALQQRDKRLAQFWGGPHREEALNILRKLVYERCVEDEIFTVYKPNGEPIKRMAYHYYYDENQMVAVDGNDHRELHALGAATATITSPDVRITLYGRVLDSGVVFARKGASAIYVARRCELLGQPKNTLDQFVVFTAIMRGSVPQFLPFTDRFEAAALKWKLAGAMAVGVVPIVVRPEGDQEVTLREHVILEGWVKERFIQLFGAENWPYEREEWKESHYQKLEDIFVFDSDKETPQADEVVF